MAAEEILRFALFKEVLKPDRKKRRKLNNGQVIDSPSEADEDDDPDMDVEAEDERENEVLQPVTTSQRARAQEKARRIERGQAGPSQRREVRQDSADEDIDMEGAEALALAEMEEEQEQIEGGDLSAQR